MNVLAITIQEIFNNATIISMPQLELMQARSHRFGWSGFNLTTFTEFITTLI